MRSACGLRPRPRAAWISAAHFGRAGDIDAAPPRLDGLIGLRGVIETVEDEPASVVEARHVLDRRCGACHSVLPSDSSFGVAPAGVAFDLPAQIRSHAARIKERAVVTRTMPPANKTHITEAERAILGRWVDQGAAVP